MLAVLKLLDYYQYYLCLRIRSEIDERRLKHISDLRISIIKQLNRFNIVSGILDEPNSNRSKELLTKTFLSIISFAEVVKITEDAI